MALSSNSNAVLLVRILGLLFLILGVTNAGFIAATLLLVLLKMHQDVVQPIAFYGITSLVSSPLYILSSIWLLRRSTSIARYMAACDRSDVSPDPPTD